LRPTGAHHDIFELAEETEYIEDIDSRDGFVQVQYDEIGRDESLNDHVGTSQIREGHGCVNHDCTDDDTDYNLSDANNHQSVPVSLSVTSHPLDDQNTPPVYRATLVYN
jgi:hypothetical protein